ncbi:MAG: hypothetical protein KKD07_10655, partial [Candidatus Omnitrophica bacterium]|nr:hypothetical protein [Candidatus Omnitrophota bacterium]
MGVVHKLKKEVFDFIINKKKEEPLISCRQLSEQTSKKFEIKVSKSSVNSVLKNTMLSSSVGRRVQKKATSKKFQIPPEKKQQLLDSISSLGFTFDKKVSAENEEQKKGVPNELLEIKKEAAVFSLEKLSIDLQEHERRKRKGKIFYDEQRVKNEERVFAEENKAIKEEQSALSSQYQKEYVVPVGPKFFDEEQFLYDVKIARENKGKERKNSNLYDNAGVVFLKAAQIDMSGENLLGDLFGKNSKGMGLENFNNICSSLLFLKAFNMQSVETIENSKNDALWRLNGFKGYPGRENLFGWTQKIDFSNQLQLEYLNEKEQALSKICAFNVIFEDST